MLAVGALNCWSFQSSEMTVNEAWIQLKVFLVNTIKWSILIQRWDISIKLLFAQRCLLRLQLLEQVDEEHVTVMLVQWVKFGTKHFIVMPRKILYPFTFVLEDFLINFIHHIRKGLRIENGLLLLGLLVFALQIVVTHFWYGEKHLKARIYITKQMLILQAHDPTFHWSSIHSWSWRRCLILKSSIGGGGTSFSGWNAWLLGSLSLLLLIVREAWSASTDSALLCRCQFWTDSRSSFWV